ncbi:hypothetical protein [Sphingobium sp. CCH11-B1]|uniref:hypothetical protein n=1 Tax=Sphingobium sp. CCH11-B1 TaxID=1768781 RepID=UPI000ABB63D0|nr:hypothetical protein [Sphingobium sp. CCH11-B1]
MRVHFTRDYDHRWPSRAVTAFKAGWSGAVKREVGEAAIGKGRATEIANGGKPSSDAKASPPADIRGSRGMARPDDASDVGSVILDLPLDGAGQ